MAASKQTQFIRFSDATMTLRNGSKENRAEQQHLTSSQWWKVSSAEVERKCTKLTKIVDGIVKTSKEASVTAVSKTKKALPDSASKRKVKAKEMESERVKDTRNFLYRLMGSRSQLPSGRETVVNHNSEGGGLRSGGCI